MPKNKDSKDQIIRELREINETLIKDNKKLQERVDYLIRQMFGRKSEMLYSRQMRLILGLDEEPVPEEEPEEDPPPSTPGPKRKRRQFKDRLPEDLPVRTEYIDPPEVEADPKSYLCIDEESRTELSMTQPIYFQKRTVRRKYVKKADRTLPPIIVPAPTPQHLVPHRSFRTKTSALNTPFKQKWGEIPMSFNQLCQGGGRKDAYL